VPFQAAAGATIGAKRCGAISSRTTKSAVLSMVVNVFGQEMAAAQIDAKHQLLAFDRLALEFAGMTVTRIGLWAHPRDQQMLAFGAQG
jgi:hypothetical protein